MYELTKTDITLLVVIYQHAVNEAERLQDKPVEDWAGQIQPTNITAIMGRREQGYAGALNSFIDEFKIAGRVTSASTVYRAAARLTKAGLLINPTGPFGLTRAGKAAAEKWERMPPKDWPEHVYVGDGAMKWFTEEPLQP